MKNIVVVGAGYVGLANALMLAESENVTLLDINKERIDELNKLISPLNDNFIIDYVKHNKLKYDIPKSEYYKNADFIFIATNTDYDEALDRFNLNSVYSVIDDINKVCKSGTTIVIKSTIPVGFTAEAKKMYPEHNFIFSPEFLREGFALYDNLYPDRIVVGDKSHIGETIAQLLMKNTLRDDIPMLLCDNKEAEVIKLFANTYLATRVSFVNEMDTFCQSIGINSKNVVDGVGLDHRIGLEYFNPSFGFGGYCLPKDTKQLRNEFEKHNVDSSIISNIPKANDKRIKFIMSQIISLLDDKTDTIGIYRIIAKKGTDNFRSSVNVILAEGLRDAGYNVIIHEPNVQGNKLFTIDIMNNIEEFIENSHVIVANRLDDEIKTHNKIYSCDIYNEY